MTFDALIGMLAGHAWFDLASLVQLSGEPRHTLRVQLHRWCQADKLVPLRRGAYAFAERYAGVKINPAELANLLYGQSYLSTHWALGYYGIIPERVLVYTSVTTRTTQAFENAYGSFRYRHVKPSAFFGYRRANIGGQIVLLADPEKALLDLWHLEKGLWGADRMTEMRFQNFELVDASALARAAARFDSPRIIRAVAEWHACVKADTAGTREL